MRLPAKLMPASPFPLAQRLQQRLPDRKARRTCGDVFLRGALLARARRRWGRGYLHCAQERGDVDEQRFLVRRIIEFGGRRRVGWLRLGTTVGGERGARAAEVFRPASKRDGMPVKVENRVA